MSAPLGSVIPINISQAQDSRIREVNKPNHLFETGFVLIHCGSRRGAAQGDSAMPGALPRCSSGETLLLPKALGNQDNPPVTWQRNY